MGRHYRIGTRRSSLARTQAEWVRSRLAAAHPADRFELKLLTTEGDTHGDPLPKGSGGVGVFVKEIEAALLAGEIDLAVHSAKDLPSRVPSGLYIAAFPEREDPRDVLVSCAGPLASLPAGALVGTGSPRRALQLRAAAPHITVRGLRGNVDTRIRRVRDGDLQAAVLAAAGLHRLGHREAITQYLDPEVCLPAAGQGALAVECRIGDRQASQVAACLDDPATRAAVEAERAVLARLEAGCQVPVGALGVLEGQRLRLTAMVGGLRSGKLLRLTAEGGAEDPWSLGTALAERLLAAGAERLLAEANHGG